MAPLSPCDRVLVARVRAQRRTARARIAALAAVALVAWLVAPAGAHAQAQEDLPLAPASTAAPAAASAPDAAANESSFAAPAPGSAARAPSTSSAFSAPELVRSAGALVVVLGLIGGAWWWLKRTGLAPAAGGGAFEVIARHPVGRGQNVLVARFGSRILCIHQAKDGLRTLSELTDAEDVSLALSQAKGTAARREARTVARLDRHLPTVDIRGKGIA